MRREGTTQKYRRGWGSWLSMLLLLSLSAPLSSGIFDERLRSARHYANDASGMGSLLLEISRRPPLSLGFRNFFADAVWLKAVQVAGNQKMTHGDYDDLFELLTVVGNFDPKFDVPYLLGGLILGESPGHARKALQILDRGKTNHPADWRFPFYTGFTQYFSVGDAISGGMAMAEAARVPGSPPYLSGLSSRMLAEAKDPDTALALLLAIARQENDMARKAVLDRRILEATVERDLQFLERAVEQYRQRTGKYPSMLDDVVREGILPSIPAEPNGGKYLVDLGGKVRSDRVSRRLRVFQPK